MQSQLPRLLQAGPRRALDPQHQVRLAGPPEQVRDLVISGGPPQEPDQPPVTPADLQEWAPTPISPELLLKRLQGGSSPLREKISHRQVDPGPVIKADLRA